VQAAQTWLELQIWPFWHWAPEWHVPVTQLPETQM
jgi:hypothetical protein